MKYVFALVLLVPFIFTCISFIVLLKFRVSKMKATGYAADLTTPLFFVTIPVMVNAIWEIHITFYFICLLLLIGIVLTFIDWRTKKEIEIPILLKKIWRVYFVILSFVYLLLIIIGFVYTLIRYIQ